MNLPPPERRNPTTRRRSRGGRRRYSELIPRPTRARGALLELILIVAIAIGLALVIQAFVVKPYQIPSQSMEPTLDVGQRVLVNRVIYHFSDPDLGDIVVFHPPGAPTTQPVRRRAGERRSGNGEDTYNPSSQACPLPTRRSRTPTSSSGSSPGPATRSAIEDGHPVVNGEIQPTRTSSSPAAIVHAAICRKRSRFRPITTS